MIKKSAIVFCSLLGLNCLLAVVPIQAASYDVTKSNDTTAGPPYEANTLRWAVYMSNMDAHSGLGLINLTGMPAGTTLTVNGNLGALSLTSSVEISAPLASQYVIQAQNGSAYGLILSLNSGGSLVHGLAFIGFGTAGIAVTSSNVQIYDCRLGTNWWDASGYGNQDGIQVGFYSPAHVSIGIAGHPNVISGNTRYGVYADNTTNLSVVNCFIGTAGNGLAALPNGSHGICLQDNGTYGGCTQAVIGGNYNTDRNVISGNSHYGIFIGNASGLDATVTGRNRVVGNIIGMKADLSGSLPNWAGVVIQDSSNNQVGDGSQSDYNNVICGNNGSGVSISTSVPARRAEFNLVQNNEIGCVNNVPYNPGFPATAGVLISGANANLIGGRRATGVYDRNVISGFHSAISDCWGVQITAGASANTVCGNLIGLNAAGTAEVSNDYGVYLSGSLNLIGGFNDTGAARGNVISGNLKNGVQVQAGNGNTLCGNYIGLNLAGTAAVSTSHAGANGIYLGSAPVNTLIGGGNTRCANVVSGLSTYGIDISGNTCNTVVAGNLLGTSANGLAVIDNVADDLMVSNSTCRVGGWTPGEGNRVCGYSGHYGITVNGNYSGEARGNTLAGNVIGVLADGSAPFTGVNAGVNIVNSSYNFVGLKNLPAASNLIAHTGTAILVQGSGSKNGFFSNTLCAYNTYGTGIDISTYHNNNNKLAPFINAASGTYVSGTSEASDYIEVFKAEAISGGHGGSLKLIGSATASNGNWTAAVTGVANGDYVCALATDGNNNTSEFSNNALLPLFPPSPTFTPSASPTRSATATPSVSATPTVTPTRSLTPTKTVSATASASATATPSRTVSPTASGSPSITPTPTISETMTVSSTRTNSGTITPTLTVSGTPSQTATLGTARLTGKGVLAYPNPGRRTMHFVFNLDQSTEVSLRIYNLAGENVAKVQGTLTGPAAVLDWDCSSAAPGIYMVRVFQAGEAKTLLKVAVIH